MWRKGTLVHVGGIYNWQSPWGKQYGDSSKILRIKLSYDPAIPLEGICPKSTKILIQKYIGTPIFIAALFTIAKIWK